jgi:hypothetical protein
MRAIERLGIPQDVDAVREHTSMSRMHLNSYIQLSQSLAQLFLFETFCASKFKLVRTHFFLSFLAVQRLNAQLFFFLFKNQNLAHDKQNKLNIDGLYRFET